MDAKTYHYEAAGELHHHAYLIPVVLKALQARPERSLFEVGCGSGFVANYLVDQGYEVLGIDPSEQGIAHAREAYKRPKFFVGSAYDDLAAMYGQYPIVLSLEVIEHLYAPRAFARTVFDLLLPGGVLILSTPYHGYLKNVALALSGKLDDHFGPLWDHGHIKFWSLPSLQTLLAEAGFVNSEFKRIGRIPPLAKSIVVCAYKPPA